MRSLLFAEGATPQQTLRQKDCIASQKSGEYFMYTEGVRRFSETLR